LSGQSHGLLTNDRLLDRSASVTHHRTPSFAY
jgi:hypothetical protein